MDPFTLQGPPQCDEGPTMSVFSPDRGGSAGRSGGGGATAAAAAAPANLRQSMHAIAANQRGRLSTVHLFDHVASISPSAAPSPAITATEQIAIEAYITEDPPRGRHILINLLATHGDGSEIGLTGVELFDSVGRMIAVEPGWVLDSYDDSSPIKFGAVGGITDPRRNPANLFNGVNNTTDATQMYVAPYTPGGHHIICVVLPFSVELSMLRFYNYNADRVHTAKGAQIVEVTVDDELAFRGSVVEAIGEVCDGSDGRKHGISNCENVIFNDDPSVLSNVLAYTSATAASAPDESSNVAPNLGDSPPTRSIAPSAERSHLLEQIVQRLTMKFATDGSDRNGAVGPTPCAFPQHAPLVSTVAIEFLTTWGDESWVGLSALEFENERGEPIFIGGCSIDRSGCEGSSEPLPGDSDVSAVLDNDPSTAAVWAFVPGMQLRVTFAVPTKLGRIRVANYGLLRGTHCGAKLVRVIGEAPASPAAGTPSPFLISPGDGVVLRKAPSNSFTLRFQSFDISATAMDLQGGGAGGGMGGVLTSSMTASMTTRARIAMKRARMSLRQPPEWLESFLPYATPLLPVAYVFKFVFRVRKDVFISDAQWAAAVGALDEDGAELQPASSFSELDGLSFLESKLSKDFETRTVMWVFDAPVALSAVFLRDQSLAPAVSFARYYADDDLIAELAPREPDGTAAVAAMPAGVMIVPSAAGSASEVLELAPATAETAVTTAFFTYDETVLSRFFQH